MEAAERAARYLEGLKGRSVAPPREALERLEGFDLPLQPEPIAAEAVLAELDELGSAATVASAGPRYFGFVTGGTLPAALAANFLAGAWDQNAVFHVASPATAFLEDVCRRWLVALFGLPPDAGIGFVTGATVANFSALAAARHALLERLGWDVEARGLFGAPPITVVVGAEVHVSVLKALSLLGLGRERVVRVAADGHGRMRPEAIPALTEPAIICVQAGNVNTGAFDPAAEICAAAQASGSWVHVDGAFGLWAAACPERAHLAAGIPSAHSWATDAHKWLNVPYDSGIVFVRNPQHLKASMSSRAAYLIAGDTREPSHLHAGALAPGAGSGDLGGPAVARPHRFGRSDRAQLPVRPAFRRRAEEGRLRCAQRGGAEPGAGLLRKRRAHPPGGRQGTGGRHLLVRQHRMAGPCRHAHQCLLVGDDRGGCRAQPAGHHPAGIRPGNLT